MSTTTVAVNDLAVQAKNDPAAMLPLWDAVRRLIATWAFRYTQHAPEQGTRLYDLDDLLQAGYLALVDAVSGYDPKPGAAFTSYLHFHIRNHFADVAGRRGAKRRPEVYAASLDEPLNDADGDTRADLIPNPAAEFADGVTEREAIRQDCAALMGEIEKLPDNQREAIMLTGWDGLTLDAAACVMGVTRERVRQTAATASRKVRNTPTGRRIYIERYPIRRVGLATYKVTFTSEVEAYLLWNEQRHDEWLTAIQAARQGEKPTIPEAIG